MARISQYSIADERMKELIGQLWNAFSLLENREEVKKFLSKFFTGTEIQMLAKRLELLKLADSDLEVNKLRRWIGVAKVTVYEWLDKHDAYEKEFHIILDRLKDQDKEYLDRLKRTIDKIEKLPQLGSGIAYHGYTKRKRSNYVLNAMNN